MIDVKTITGRMGIKKSSTGPWISSDPDNNNKDKYNGGVCPACKQYDVEVDSLGFCRDEDCRWDRIVKALHSGEAMMTEDKLLVWTPGCKIREMKNK